MSRRDIQLVGGVTYRDRFYVLQSDGVTIVGDLTGFSVTMTIGASTYAGTIVTAASALCEIELSPTETDAIADGQYWYQITVSNGADVYLALEGWATK